MLKREPLAQRPSRAWAVLAETLLSGFFGHRHTNLGQSRAPKCFAIGNPPGAAFDIAARHQCQALQRGHR